MANAVFLLFRLFLLLFFHEVALILMMFFIITFIFANPVEEDPLVIEEKPKDDDTLIKEYIEEHIREVDQLPFITKLTAMQLGLIAKDSLE